MYPKFALTKFGGFCMQLHQLPETFWLTRHFWSLQQILISIHGLLLEFVYCKVVKIWGLYLETQGFIILSDITFNYNVYQGEGVISSTGEYLHVETPSGWPPGHMSSCTTSSFLSDIFFRPVGRPQTSATCRWKTTCRRKMAPRVGGFLISVTWPLCHSLQTCRPARLGTQTPATCRWKMAPRMGGQLEVLTWCGISLTGDETPYFIVRD